MSRWVSFIGDSCLGLRCGKGPLQAGIGELHQHDIHHDQRDIHQDRALSAKVKRQRKTRETHVSERVAMSGMPNDTKKPISISTEISTRFVRQYNRCARAIAAVTGGGTAKLEGGGIEDMCLSTKCFKKRQSGSTSCADSLYKNGSLKQGAVLSSQMILEQIQRASPS
jgi:hypothetical protein